MATARALLSHAAGHVRALHQTNSVARSWPPLEEWSHLPGLDPVDRVKDHPVIGIDVALDELGRAGGRTRLDRLVAAGHQLYLYGPQQLPVNQPNHRTKEFVPAEPPTSRPQEVSTSEGTSPRMMAAQRLRCSRYSFVISRQP